MIHLVIGQRRKAPNFSAFHWSLHGSLVSIGQHFVTTRVVHLPKRTETSLITESDQSGPNHQLLQLCTARTALSDSDQAVQAAHGCNSWLLEEVYLEQCMYTDDLLFCKKTHISGCYNVCVCVYSNSRNDVPRVARRYGTIAAHTRRRASDLVVFVVFCVHMYSFAGLIRRTPPPTFSDTAITDRHFAAQSSLVRISWSIGSEKSFGHVPSVGVEPSTSCMQGKYPIH